MLNPANVTLYPVGIPLSVRVMLRFPPPTEAAAQASGKEQAEELITRIRARVKARLKTEQNEPIPKTPEEVRKVTANMNPLEKKLYMKKLKQAQGSNVADMATIWSSGGNV